MGKKKKQKKANPNPALSCERRALGNCSPKYREAANKLWGEDDIPAFPPADTMLSH